MTGRLNDRPSHRSDVAFVTRKQYFHVVTIFGLGTPRQSEAKFTRGNAGVFHILGVSAGLHYSLLVPPRNREVTPISTVHNTHSASNSESAITASPRIRLGASPSPFIVILRGIRSGCPKDRSCCWPHFRRSLCLRPEPAIAFANAKATAGRSPVGASPKKLG